MCPALQPKQHETDHRDHYVCIEDHTGVPGLKVLGFNHLVDVPARCTEEEDRGADHCGEPEIETTTKGEKPDNREAQTCETDLSLKRTVLPTHKTGRHLAEEGVHHEIIEKAEAYGKKKEIGEQLLDDNRRRQRMRSTQEREALGDKPYHQER